MDTYFEILRSCGSLFNNSYVISDYNREDCPLVYVNQAFLDLTGYSEDEVLEKNCRFLQGEKTSTLTIRQVSECVSRSESGWFDIINYKKNGELFWNRLTLLPIRSELDSTRFYIGIQQDVTDLKESNQSMKDFGNLKSSSDNLTKPLMNILNATRSLKYLDNGTDQANQRIAQLADDSRREVMKIADYVRALG